MNTESNDSEIVGYFCHEDEHYGKSRLENRRTARFKGECVTVETTQGEEIDIEWDIASIKSFDTQQIVEEKEGDSKQDESFNFVEENTFMVGY